MTPLPTYDRRHPAPVAPVRRTSSSGLSIVRHRRRPIALTAALILVAALIGGASLFVWDGPARGIGAMRSRTRSRHGTRRWLRRRRCPTASRDSERPASWPHDARAGKLKGERRRRPRAELLAMLGPALDDGRYFGALIAVGAAQEPPRLVIDIEQWFTDQAARRPRSKTAYRPGDVAPGVLHPEREPALANDRDRPGGEGVPFGLVPISTILCREPERFAELSAGSGPRTGSPWRTGRSLGSRSSTSRSTGSSGGSDRHGDARLWMTTPAVAMDERDNGSSTTYPGGPDA